jgi:hypothetical protein
MRLTRGCLSCVAVLACLVSLGCEREHKPAPRHGPVGVLTGRVRLAERAQLPAYPSLDLAGQPLRQNRLPALPPECAAANEAARTPVELATDRLLAGIVVAASDFTHFREREPQLHEVAIQSCRLQPSLIAARGGDVLAFENRDAYGFEPLIGPTFSAHALRRGHKLRLPLISGSVESILCSRSAPCGRTDLVVFYHPVYAVADARGEFRIDDFPAAELVRVSAWHPLFEQSDTFVWLEPGEHNAVELELTPKQRFSVVTK